MAQGLRHILIALASLAAAVPVRIQLDLGYGSTLPITNGSALAKGGGGGNGNGNNGGHGNGGGNGHGGGRSGGSASGSTGNGNANGGRGNSDAGGLGGGRGGAGRGTSAGAGLGRDNAGGDSSRASAGKSGRAGSSHGANAGHSGQASSGKGQRAKATAQASKAPARTPGAGPAASVRAQPTGAAAVAEEIDRRPRPRRSTRFIIASGLSQENLARLTAQGFRIEARSQGRIAPQVVRLRIPSGTSVARARQEVRLVEAQASVDFDQFYYLDEAPTTCTGAACKDPSPIDWSALVNWTEAHPLQCGPPPLIGLIDTGVNVEHTALKGQAVEIMPLPVRHTVVSLQEHGTAVAALLVGRPASRTPGLLPQAKIIAVDAFYRDGGTADRTDVMTLVAAVEALAERGVRVINMSLSGPSNEVLQKAIAAAQAKGIVIVAAAGNNGAGAEPSYPAAYPGVIAVTAVDRDLNVYRRATRGSYIDLSAPGVSVWTASSQGAGLLRTGTSYAVPFVSAAAGLVLASNPELDAGAVRARLEESARDLGQPGRDPTFGYGLIQMAGLCAQPAEPPAMATVHETLGVHP